MDRKKPWIIIIHGNASHRNSFLQSATGQKNTAPGGAVVGFNQSEKTIYPVTCRGVTLFYWFL